MVEAPRNCGTKWLFPAYAQRATELAAGIAAEDGVAQVLTTVDSLT